MQTFFRIALVLFITLTWQTYPVHAQTTRQQGFPRADQSQQVAPIQARVPLTTVQRAGEQRTVQLGQEDTIDVVATGIGRDSAEALQNAFSAAVEQAVGLLVRIETRIENGELISNRILTASRGFVESYEQVGEPRIVDGLVSTQIVARVKRNDLSDQLQSAGVVTIAMDGRSLAAQAITKEMSREDATEMLLDFLESFPANIYDFSTAWRYDLDIRRVVVDVETRIDSRKYTAFVREFTEMLPLLGGRAGGSVSAQLTRGEISVAPGGLVPQRMRGQGSGSTENVGLMMPTVQFSISHRSLNDRQFHGFVVADSWANLRVTGQQFPVDFRVYAVPESVFGMIRPMFAPRNMIVKAVDSSGNVVATSETRAPMPVFNARSLGTGAFYINHSILRSNLVFIFPSLCIESQIRGTAVSGPTLRPGMPEARQQVFLDLSQAQMARITAVHISLE